MHLTLAFASSKRSGMEEHMFTWSFDRTKLVSLVVTLATTAHLSPAPAFAQNASASTETIATAETPTWENLTQQAEQFETAGELKQAEKFFNQALQLSKSFNTDDVRRIKAIENLGHVLETEGRYTTAEALYQQALELRQSEYGDGSHRLSRSHFNIGRVQLLAGDYAHARENLTRALNLRQFSGSEEKNQQDMPLVFILFNLGVLETETGNFEKAEQYLKRCQSISQNLAKHKESARILSQLAILSLAESDFPKAENQAYTAVNLADRFGKDDLLVKAQALNTVALVQIARGNLQEASNASNESWAIKRKLLGLQHPLTADSLLTAGLINLAKKKYEAAEKSFDEALGVYNQTLNQHHLSYSRALIGRSFSHLKQRNSKPAKRDLTRGVELLAASTGAGRHLPAKYKDLFIEKLGPNYSVVDLMVERVKNSNQSATGDFDTFGQLLSISLADEEQPDTFYNMSYRDIFTALGVMFVALILLAMAVLIPGAFSMLFPWGREERGPNARRRNRPESQQGQTVQPEKKQNAPMRKTTESERRQLQLWKGRLATLETERPKSESVGKASGNYERIDFKPLGNSSNSTPTLAPPDTMHIQPQTPSVGATEGNGETFKW
jgi:tetratricopeptide (TPR) repeat protein